MVPMDVRRNCMFENANDTEYLPGLIDISITFHQHMICRHLDLASFRYIHHVLKTHGPIDQNTSQDGSEIVPFTTSMKSC